MISKSLNSLIDFFFFFSETVNEPFEQDKEQEEAGTSYTWLIILLLIVAGGGVAFAYWKNKRSHINFKNLANSHYNTRSGSTTFTGVNGLGKVYFKIYSLVEPSSFSF